MRFTSQVFNKSDEGLPAGQTATPKPPLAMNKILLGTARAAVMDEAAMIDGCTRAGALRRVIVPLTLPGLGATLGVVPFLVQAIHRAAHHAEKQTKVSIAEVGRSILDGVVGFDLNPLAVLAARTNYLIAFARFLPYVRPISIPQNIQIMLKSPN